MTEPTPSYPKASSGADDPTVTDGPAGADAGPIYGSMSSGATSDPALAPSSQPTDSGSSGTTETAKAEASELKDTAGSAAQDVAGTAKEQAQQVAGEVGQRSRDLLSQASSELSDQAGHQQQRLADSVGGYAGELRSMASNSDQSGPVTDLMHQAADRGEQVASWLSDRQPRELLDDVSDFARRRPVAFLAIAAGAGILVGRLSRGLFADAKGGDPALQSNRNSGSGSARAVTGGRPSASLQEVPTSGTGAGPTFDDPLNEPLNDPRRLSEPTTGAGLGYPSDEAAGQPGRAYGAPEGYVGR